jgi:hypothetical protein
MKKKLSALLLAVLLALPAQAQNPAADTLFLAYLNNRTLAELFRASALFDPMYRGLAYYFEGRAQAFAQSYEIVTGTRVE